MDTRVCKVCGVEKPFAKGSWLINRGKPAGRICLTCHTEQWKDYHRAYAAAIKSNIVKYEIQKERSRLCMSKLRGTDTGKAQLNTNNANWYKRNRPKAIANEIARQLRKQQRVPRWLTGDELGAISKLYLEARLLTQATGIAYHVDHIIPLQGKLVSGLHVLANLRVITATENISKGNKYANLEAA